MVAETGLISMIAVLFVFWIIFVSVFLRFEKLMTLKPLPAQCLPAPQALTQGDPMAHFSRTNGCPDGTEYLILMYRFLTIRGLSLPCSLPI